MGLFYHIPGFIDDRGRQTADRLPSLGNQMSSSLPAIGITARVAGPVRWVAGAPCLPLGFPQGSPAPEGPVAGRYFLARCAEETEGERTDWQIYLRRPLYAVQQRGEEWLLHLPPDDDPGHTWLRGRADGESVHLLGPFGNGFSLRDESHNLLLLADLTTNPGGLALLAGLIEPSLDRGCRVTLLLRAETTLGQTALAGLPIAVEVQTAPDEASWQRALDAAILWADQVAAALPADRYSALAQVIKTRRFRLEEGFCQLLVQTDILCGVGACLACVIPTANGGITRACTHGPVFDLTQLIL